MMIFASRMIAAHSDCLKMLEQPPMAVGMPMRECAVVPPCKSKEAIPDVAMARAI